MAIQLARLQPPNHHLQVEAIQKGTRQAPPVLAPQPLAAAAGPHGIAEPAAWAGVGGGHEGDRAGKADPLAGAADPHLPLLQGLAQLVEHVAAVLGEFIEEEHAPVGQGQFPGPRDAAAPTRAALEQLW